MKRLTLSLSILASLLLTAGCFHFGKNDKPKENPAIAAELLYSYVSEETYRMILNHQDFQGLHFYEHYGADPRARDQHVNEPWFALAARFADEWDQCSFDPAYPTHPLEHFEARLRALFLQPTRRRWSTR